MVLFRLIVCAVKEFSDIVIRIAVIQDNGIPREFGLRERRADDLMPRFFNGLCIFLGQTEKQDDYAIGFIDVDETGLTVFLDRVMGIRERQARLGLIDAEIELCLVTVFLIQLVGYACH